MSKKSRLLELRQLIKKTYNLDLVTAVSTKSQYKKAGLEYRDGIVLFKMTYTMTGDDIVETCPISWLVIAAGEDELIVKTCGEVLLYNREIKEVLSSMAENAKMRAGNG